MVARVVIPVNGRTVFQRSTRLPVDQRAIILNDPNVEWDDAFGNHFARSEQRTVQIGRNLRVLDVFGQASGVYHYPHNMNINGWIFSADFGRRVVNIRVYNDANNRDIPIFAVLHRDNSWMTNPKIRDQNNVQYRVPEAYFANLAQLELYVSQMSVVVAGSAYRLFMRNGAIIGDVLHQVVRPNNRCRVWIQVRRNLPNVFVNPNMANEIIQIFPMNNQTFPRQNVIGGTPMVGRTAGQDTIDMTHYLSWRERIGRRMGRPLNHWIR